ncbi:proteasome subunit beta [Frankia sp. CcI156]|nr:proteasome subunit beta [Frankia sp. CgIM4]OHV53785.1 proteasome subunit beta [Frankia sp. CgIS1]ONH25445.1 proteasome subunit beta [Frankia sp. CcI156]ORT53248.1 proteasome subunit beta [Frankia sp. KB5]ORT98170.1 proteasome subunit beta [Frankia casuarinae]TFE29795.1 proteasome subunit beta [Frankia sp. B2]
MFMTPGTSSFADFLSRSAPHLLPGARSGLPGPVTEVAHGTTIVAVAFPGGVIMAGDRRATQGHMIAQRDVEKVHHADDYSCVGYAGTAGVGAELIRLFQVELEHYEKIEGSTLSLDAKANRLAAMVKGNLPMALQGLAVVPLFAGYDLDTGKGRIFSYDIAAAKSEERTYESIGSGSVFAKGSLKKRFRSDLSQDDAVRISVEALYDAADDDSATGGPDVIRKLYPIVAVVTADGYRRYADDEIEPVVTAIIADRSTNSGG